jgi:hypothetical protein
MPLGADFGEVTASNSESETCVGCSVIEHVKNNVPPSCSTCVELLTHLRLLETAFAIFGAAFAIHDVAIGLWICN